MPARTCRVHVDVARLAGSLPASVTIIRTLLFALSESRVSNWSSSRTTRLTIAFIRSVSGSRSVLHWSVQKRPNQVDHVRTARLAGACAASDEIHLRRPLSTDRAPKQIEHVIVLAWKRLGAAVGHPQQDGLDD